MRDIVVEVEIAERYSEAIHERRAREMCVFIYIFNFYARVYIVEKVGVKTRVNFFRKHFKFCLKIILKILKIHVNFIENLLKNLLFCENFFKYILNLLSLFLKFL